MKTDYKAWAQKCAYDAHNNYFSSWRGMWYFEDFDCLVYYDNYPYAQDPKRRDREIAAFRGRLAYEGIEVLAQETTDDGYSLAMVIDAPKIRETEIIGWMQEILNERN